MQKIAAFLGAWWSGKSTHAVYAREIFGLIKPINYTTRKKRNLKDNDYIHINLEIFHNKFIKWELFNAINFDGNLYGFNNDTIQDTSKLIICIAPQALDYVTQYTKETNASLLTVFFDAPEDELRRRILKRWVSTQETQKRIITDQIEIKNRPQTYDYILDTQKSLQDVRIELMPVLERFFNK